MSRKPKLPATDSNATAVAPQRREQQSVVFQHTNYQGLIPPPELLRGFDQVAPGTSAKLIRWAEEEQTHRRVMEREAQQANITAQSRQLDIAAAQSRAVFRSDALGQILGFLVCAMSIAGSVYAGVQDHDILAAALAAIPTAAVIQAFRLSMMRKKSSSDAQA